MSCSESQICYFPNFYILFFINSFFLFTKTLRLIKRKYNHKYYNNHYLTLSLRCFPLRLTLRLSKLLLRLRSPKSRPAVSYLVKRSWIELAALHRMPA